MAKARGDFTDILIRRQTLSPDQLEEARGLERQAGMKLADAIVKLGYATPDQVMSAVAEHHGLQSVDLTETESSSGSGSFEESDAPVVKLVNLIIQEAVSLRASDIHIEPFVDRVRVRYRIDGVLVERDSPPRRLLAPMLSRIKIMASIDISEKRRPQDGRIKMMVSGKHFDL